MLQIAVFVDSGYLYAQGSALLDPEGQRQKRTDIRLNVEDLITALKNRATDVALDARLLRIYWYDGMPRGGRLSTEQAWIARSHDLKLRLGMINSLGEQKGVDSLIVTDLIELARNQAISDALIISGDEDIRVGVQVAQTFGVRVHLIGIEPARESQSPDLMNEVDTCVEWGHADVRSWMTLRSDLRTAPVDTGRAEAVMTEPTVVATDFEENCAKVISEVLDQMHSLDLDRLKTDLDSNRDQIPSDIDRPTLSRLHKRLGRLLTDEERRAYRRLFVAQIRKQ